LTCCSLLSILNPMKIKHEKRSCFHAEICIDIQTSVLILSSKNDDACQLVDFLAQGFSLQAFSLRDLGDSLVWRLGVYRGVESDQCHQGLERQSTEQDDQGGFGVLGGFIEEANGQKGCKAKTRLM
jgi:hypothetical protein